MIDPIPTTVTDVLGESAAHDLASWVARAVEERTISRDQWAATNGRLDQIEERFVGEFASLRSEIVAFRRDMDARFDSMNAQFNDRFDRQSEQLSLRFERLEERMAAQTRWAVGMLGLMGTLVTLLLAIERLGIAGS